MEIDASSHSDTSSVASLGDVREIPDNDEDDTQSHASLSSSASNHSQEDKEEEPYIDDSIAVYEHNHPVYTVAAHPTYPYIFASGGGDDKAFVWNTKNPQESRKCVAEHTDSVIQVAFQKYSAPNTTENNSVMLASAGMDGKIIIVNVTIIQDAATQAEEIQIQPLHILDAGEEVTWIDWNAHGPFIASGSSDAIVYMYNANSGACKIFAGHSESVACGSFTNDGKQLITASSDGTMIIWNPKTETPLHRLEPKDARFHQSEITCLATDGNIILSGDAEGGARVVNIKSGQILQSMKDHAESLECVAFSSVMPFMATGGLDGKLHIYDISTSRIRTTCVHEAGITNLYFDKTQPLIMSTCADHIVRLWDIRTGTLLKTWRGHQDCVLSGAIGAESVCFVSGGDDGVCLVWE